MSLIHHQIRSVPRVASISLLAFATACGSEAPLDEASGARIAAPRSDDVDSTQQALLSVHEVANYPEYFGSSGSDPLCWENRASGTGFEPDAAGRYPLFLYFVGTGDQYTSPVAKEVTRVMATRGYVAVSVNYENTLDFAAPSIARKAGCIFDPARADSLTGVLCSRVNVDCSRGIVTWGHSQGAAMAWGGGDYDSRVRAAWLTGYGQGFGSRAWTLTHTLPRDRVRIVNGVLDGDAPPSNPEHPNHIPTLNELTGRACAAGTANCLNGPNGSGWYLVQDADVLNRPDHCWFAVDGFQCIGSYRLEPSWIPPSEAVWSINANTAWLTLLTALGAPPARTLSFEFTGFQTASPPAPTALTDQYPWGVVDWTAGNFNVRLPGSGVAQNHAVVGSSTGPDSGTIQFVGPQGRRLESVVVHNPGPGSVTFSAVATRLDRTTVAAPTLEVGIGERTIPFTFGDGIRSVSFGVSRGSQLKWKRFNVYGAAPAPVPTAPCPSPRIALRSRGNNLYVTTSALGNQLLANGTISQATTFDCLNQTGGTLVLRAPSGHVGVFNRAAGNLSLYANKSLAAADRFRRIDLSKGFAALRATADLQYVVTEVWGGGVLNANRPDAATWEHFQMEVR